MLHRKRPREPKNPANATVSPRFSSAQQNIGSKKAVLADQNMSTKPSVQPPASDKATTKSTQQRPSGLPRSTSGNSGPRLQALATSRNIPTVCNSIKPPTQHLRSSSEDVPLMMDFPTHSNLPPEAGDFGYDFPPPPAGRPRFPQSSLDMDQDTILGIALPEKALPIRPSVLPPRLIPELQALASRTPKISTASQYAASSISSPSTRLTESPAPWSASTATSTPVSWPSASPGIVQQVSMKPTEKRSNTVPQPRVGRSRLPKLPVLQESVPTSKVPSSIKSEKIQPGTPSDKIKRKPVAETPAPTPPPRTSSAKRAGGRNPDKSGSSSIDETLSRAAQSSTAPSSTEPDFSPLAGRTNQKLEHVGDSLRKTDLGDLHDNLQQSISITPIRPSREGTTDLGESRPTVVNDHKAAFSDRHRQLLASAFEDKKEHNASTSGPGLETLDPPRRPASPRAQQSPNRLGKLSRLGIFGRHGRSPSLDVEKSPKKLQRKGPVAGTGHEGYGKYGRRVRKASVEAPGTGSDSDRSLSSTRRAPLISSSRKGSNSGSAQKRTSQSDLDEFTAPRMKPLVMRGGSKASVDREETSTQNFTLENPRGRGVTPSPVSSDWGVNDQPQVMSATQEQWRAQKAAPKSSANIRPLALRRSQRFGPGTETFRIPTPIRTDDLTAPQYITSHDTSKSSAIQTLTASSGSANDLYRLDPTMLKTQDKKLRRPWWNPFRRRREYLEATVKEVRSQPQVQPGMAVSISAGPAPRSVPYYVVMESESENNTTEMIGDYFSEAVESAPGSPERNATNTSDPELQRYTDSVLLPTAPIHPNLYMDVTALAPDMDNLGFEPAPVRQPRLAHVGRIPKVVARNERQHVPSRRSFSQPFARKTPYEIELPENWGVLEPQNDKPILEIHTDILPSRPFTDIDTASAKPASAPAGTYIDNAGRTEEFSNQLLRFPSKQESEISVSSSSEGIISVLGPPLIPTKAQQMLRHPAPGIASTSHGDDEIWNEFDDFIDHVMSPSRSQKGKQSRQIPSKTRIAASSSSPVVGVIPARSKPNLRIAPLGTRKFTGEASLPTSLTPPVVFPSPSLLPHISIGEDIRLRRSRIVSALHSSIDPSSPFSMREFLNEYGEKYRDSIGLPERMSTSTTGPAGTVTPTTKALSVEPKIERNHGETAALLDVVERSKNPVALSELHYASLEVSRWLSFGRVLFSPAHEEIHTLPERHVLVIDGLGNEDWSIYCAVTYEPEKAIVYDLKETSNPRGTPKQQESEHMPTNHRRTEVLSLAQRFPFHSSFFSAIVLRFPPAMAETKLKNIISECRRTLVPGGHLEVMLLDLDIVNMGVQTRRAVRELKMRMATRDRDVSLKPVIDNFQNLLGGRDFSSLNRCVVGVPVAGRPSGSIDSSSSSRSSRGSGGNPSRTSIDATQFPRLSEGKASRSLQGPNFSLNDLVADHSENADAKIGRMVSRTARSWWQHCFEASVIRDGDLSRSIFADKKVLGECKSRASSFKLLIAYAQRPVFEARRRTMSEPGGTTTATAGIQRGSKIPK